MFIYQKMKRRLMQIDRLEKLVEDSSNFLVGTLGKRIAWSAYFPLRLLVKRREYVEAIRVPSKMDHAKSGVLTGIGIALAKTIGLGFEKGTTGYLLFKNCPLVGARIKDFFDLAIIEIIFPVAEKYADGLLKKGYDVAIKANVKGFRFVNKRLLGTKFEIYGGKRELEDLLKNEKLRNLCEKYFSQIIYWTSLKGVGVISLTVKDFDEKRMSVIEFSVPRFNKKQIDFHRQNNKDVEVLPEIIFDISREISEELLEKESIEW